jgi:hypothetical protein
VSINQNKFANNTNAGILIADAGATTSDIVISGNGSTDDASFANFSGTNLKITTNHTNDTDKGDDANQGLAIRLKGVNDSCPADTINTAAFSGIAVRDSEFGQHPTNNVTVKASPSRGTRSPGLCDRRRRVVAMARARHRAFAQRTAPVAAS